MLQSNAIRVSNRIYLMCKYSCIMLAAMPLCNTKGATNWNIYYRLVSEALHKCLPTIYKIYPAEKPQFTDTILDYDIAYYYYYECRE